VEQINQTSQQPQSFQQQQYTPAPSLIGGQTNEQQNKQANQAAAAGQPQHQSSNMSINQRQVSLTA